MEYQRIPTQIRKSITALPVMIFLVFLFLSSNARAQGRGFKNVTAIQLKQLPKLTDGVQAWADYDKDGYPDLFICGKTASGDYGSFLLHNTGNSFEDQSSLLPDLPQLAKAAAAWADFDQDGKIDLVISGETNDGFASRLYHNTGGSFEDKSNMFVDGDNAGLPALGNCTLTWGHFSGNNYFDLLITGRSANGNVGRFYTFYKGSYFLPDAFLQYARFPNLPALYNSKAVAADFNTDGWTDVVISGSGGVKSMTKFYLSSAGKYVDASLADLDNITQVMMDIADYDQDGRTDLLLTGKTTSGNVNKLYHNIQEKSWSIFSEVNTGIPGVKRAKIGWADYDLDNLPDLVIAGVLNDGGLFTKLYHNKQGSFEDKTPAITNMPFIDGAIAWGDYNNDHWPDLFFSGNYDPSHSNSLNYTLLSNNHDGTFFNDRKKIAGTNPVKEVQLPVTSNNATWIDYSNAGRLDLMITGQLYDGDGDDTYSQRFYFLNEGNKFDNTFFHKAGEQYPQAFPMLPDAVFPTQDGCAVWGDYNNDNKPDLLLMGQYEGPKAINKNKTKVPLIYLLQNTGYNTYMKNVTGILPANHPALTYSAAEWGDYDNDGFKDLIISGSSNSNGTDCHTLLYHNNGGQNFSDVSNLLPNLPQVAYGAVSWGDYDNDGRLDLLVSGKTSNGTGVSKLYHNTIQGFIDASNLLPNLPGVYTSAVKWIDYDHDGLLDLFLSGDAATGPVTKLYRNNGALSIFEDQANLLSSIPGISNGAAAFGDYDKDGRPDIYLTGKIDNGSDTSFLMHNTPEGFTKSTLLSRFPAASGGSVSWVDYNNDSWPDLLTMGISDTGSVFNLLENTPLFRFDLPLAEVTTWGDYNNDGRLDLFVAGEALETKNPNSKLYENTPEGFIDVTSLICGLPQLYQAFAVWGDYDNDGLLDLAISGFASNYLLRLYHNTGNGFEDKSNLLPKISTQSGRLAWLDYDNDGHLDLFLTNTQAITNKTTNALLRNTGAGFQNATAFLDSMAGLRINAGGSIAIADYNRDGRQDILLSGTFNNGVESSIIYQNTATGFQAIPGVFPVLPTDISGASFADYDGDGWVDVFICGRDSKLYHISDTAFEDKTDALPGIGQGPGSAHCWGDFDNDGRVDLYVASLGLYHNNGNGFDLKQLYQLPQIGGTSAAFGDYDGDRKLDLFTSGYTFTNETHLNLLYFNETPIIPVAPGTPQHPMSAKGANDSTVVLSWQPPVTIAPGSLSYNLSVGDQPGSQNIIGPMADLTTGLRRIAATGNLQTTEYMLRGLVPGKRYYWRVQAIDQAFVGSVFSDEQSFVLDTAGGTLAIKMLNLEATNMGNRNELKWKTTMESMGDRFIIERSSDASHFQTLGEISAKGVAGTYIFYDNHPLEGNNYYRLRMLNADGVTAITKTVLVKNAKQFNWSLTTAPNPVTDILNIRLQNVTDSRLELIVTDINGLTLLSKPVQVDHGSYDGRLSVVQLNPGYYFLQIIGDMERKTIKFLKL